MMLDFLNWRVALRKPKVAYSQLLIAIGIRLKLAQTLNVVLSLFIYYNTCSVASIPFFLLDTIC